MKTLLSLLAVILVGFVILLCVNKAPCREHGPEWQLRMGTNGKYCHSLSTGEQKQPVQFSKPSFAVNR